MVKKIFSYIFAVFLIISVVLSSVSVSAYEITSFEITAKAGALISLDTGEVLFEKNMDKKMYPASITKIMSAILVLESDKFNPKQKITMTDEIDPLVTGTGLAVSNLKVGETITHNDLIHAIMISSLADCTYLASIYFGGSVQGFVKMMNDKAEALGLENTNYTNPVGLHDKDTYTTVRDVYKLTEYALKNKTFKSICSKSRYTMKATNKSGSRVLSTTNFLLDTTTNYFYQYAKGVKTGFTDEAGRCVVSYASYNGYTYICIIMGCPNSPQKRYEFAESADLYRWAFNNFSFKEVANSSEPVCEIPVELSMDTDFIPLYFDKPFVSVLPNDADESTIVVKTKLYKEKVQAPVKKGTVLGEAEVVFAENVIGKVKLISGQDVESHWVLKTADAVKNFFSSVYMKVIYGLIAIVVVIFIILCIKMNMKHFRKRRVKYVPYNGKERENKRK